MYVRMYICPACHIYNVAALMCGRQTITKKNGTNVYVAALMCGRQTTTKKNGAKAADNGLPTLEWNSDR